MIEKIAENFWKQVDKNGNDQYPNCWIWVGQSINKRTGRQSQYTGYGSYYLPYDLFQYKGKFQYAAHRIAWMLTNGEIPKGKNICHSCDNTICVRPDHLFIGTQKDNMHDAIKKGRHKPISSHGVQNVKARLNENLIILIRTKWKNINVKFLAQLLNVTPSLIFMIKRNAIWKDVVIPKANDPVWKILNKFGQ